MGLSPQYYIQIHKVISLSVLKNMAFKGFCPYNDMAAILAHSNEALCVNVFMILKQIWIFRRFILK